MRNNNEWKETQSGFMALSLILLLSAVVLLITATAAMTGIGEMQASLGLYRGESELGFVEGCAEDALLKINEDSGFGGGNIERPEGTCIVTINPGGGGPVNWDISVNSNSVNYRRGIRLIFVREYSEITLISWKEI